MRWGHLLSVAVLLVGGCTRDNTGGGDDELGSSDDLGGTDVDLSGAGDDLAQGGGDLAADDSGGADLIVSDLTLGPDLSCVGAGTTCGVAAGGCQPRIACVAGLPVCQGTFVALSGNDTNDGVQGAPLRTINAAIARAVALGNGTDVCICDPPGGAVSVFSEDVSLVEGVSLFGALRCDNWTKDLPNAVTRIQNTTAGGVKVPAGVTAATAIDGVQILALPANAGNSIALDINASSPQLTDVALQGGPAPTAIGLYVHAAAPGATGPSVTRGNFNARANAAGAETAVRLENASATFSGAVVTAGNAAGAITPDTSIGLDCSACGATSFSSGSVTAGTSTTASTGVRISGAATTSFTGSGAGLLPIVGLTGVSARGVHLNGCTGTQTFTLTNIIGGGMPGSHWGVDANGAACNLRISGGQVTGCENGTECIGVAVSGSPINITTANIAGSRGGGATNEATGLSCTNGGCLPFGIAQLFSAQANIIAAGRGAFGSGVDLSASSASLDSNRISAPTCVNVGAGPYSGLRLRGRGSPLAVNNVISDAACATLEEAVRIERVVLGPAKLDWTVVNNTIEYTGCSACGARRGLAIIGVTGAGAAGFFDNNIVRNLNAGAPPGISHPVYQYDADTDVTSFFSNDLNDPTAAALFRYHNTTDYTITDVNDAAKLPATDQKNIVAAPLLSGTWHLPAASPCRNAGNAAHAPASDFDQQRRPNQTDPLGIVPDIGADEYYP